MDIFGRLFTTNKYIAPQPWLCDPVVENFDKHYGDFGDDNKDAERKKNWIIAKQRRALEIMPIAILITCIILLLAPKQLEPYIDDIAYGISIIALVSYVTAEYRANIEYDVFVLERKTSGFTQKEFVNYKKRNFGPQWFEWL
jgi:hypothetical protein